MKASGYFIIILLSAWLLSACTVNSSATSDKANLSPPTQNKNIPVKSQKQKKDKHTPTEEQLRAELKVAEEKAGLDSELNAKTSKPLLRIIDKLGVFYYRADRYKDALPIADRSFTIRKRVLGPEHPDTVASLNNLAFLYRNMGQYELALPLYQRVLDIREKVLGAAHPDTALGLNNLAALYRKMGQYERALPLYQRALSIREKVLGAEHSDTATSLNNLALLYQNMEQYERALPLYQRGLTISEKILGSEHSDTAISLDNLAGLYRRMGKYDQALPLFKRTLSMNEKKLGLEHPDTATSLNNLALLYKNMGQYERALPLYQRALAIREKVLGVEHPDTANSMANLAVLYKNMGQHEQALLLDRRALAVKEKVLGVEHPDTANSLNNLATLYQAMGQYERALPLHQRALSIREKKLGAEHTRTATSLNNLAFLYSEMGQYEQALPLYRRALAIREKIQGTRHPSTANSLNNLAELYRNMGKYEQALPLYQRSLTINEKTLGTEHPETAISLNNLALLYVDMGEYKQALPLIQRGLAIQEKVLGTKHPSTAASLLNMAGLYSDIGQYEQALRFYQRSLIIHKQAFGAEHPHVANVLNNLAALYQQMGQYEQALQLQQRSLSIQEKVLGTEHPDIVLSLSNLGFVYLSKGVDDEAKAAFHRAISLSQNNPGARAPLWRAQHGLSRLYVRMKFPDLAILWGKESVNTIQSLRTDLNSLDKKLQASFLTNKKHVYTKLADLLVAEGRIGEAQAVLQMIKEQELYDSLQRASKSDPRSTRIELTGLERKRFSKYYGLQSQQVELGKERSELERKLKLGEISETEKKRLAEINNQLLPPLREAMLVFLQNLQKQSDQFAKDKAYRQGESQLEMTETNLQKAMTQVQQNDPDARIAALQYVVTEKRLSILLSTPNNPPIAKQIEFDGKSLRSQVFTVRELLSDPKSDRDILKMHLQSLHTMLIAPIADDLKTLEVVTLVLVPNDILRYIPFAALYDGKRYLVQDYTLTLFNEAVKKDFNSKSAKIWKLAAMGLSLPVENLPALTNVREELDAVAIKSGMNGKSYLNEAFTRVVLKDALRKNYNVLHLASHFEFVAGRPDASRFFLGDKSSLYLGDIAREDMRFDNFSLVTFSACETGLGGGLDADGRDMESLGALVQNQGARAVMATLWKVEDSSTASLMEMFYRVRHNNKLAKAASLRKAQLKFIKRGGGKSVLAHPYYWAPFVLMGDWR